MSTAESAKVGLYSHRHLSFHPALPMGLLVVMGIVSVALIIYLYRAQRHLLSRQTLIVLLILRVSLVLLLVALLFRPAMRWTRDVHSAGTLWLVLDHSQSMALTDPQASAVERLRWACALGYIPRSLWPDQADRALGRLSVLQQHLAEFSNLQRRSRFSDNKSQQAKMRIAFTERLHAIQRQLLSLTSAISTSLGGQESGVLKSSLGRLQEMLSSINALIKNKEKPISQDIFPWAAIRTNTQIALRELSAAARQQDNQFLTSHSADTTVSRAMLHIASLTRSQLAWMILSYEPAGKLKGFIHLFEHYHVRVVSFASTATPAGSLHRANIRNILQNEFSPTGKQTNIAAGLEAVAQANTDNHDSSVVVVSDGRQNTGPDPAGISRLLAAGGIHVFTLLIGAEQSAPAATIKDLQSPTWIYKHSLVKAAALIHLTGLAGKTIKVEFLRGTKLLATKQITPGNMDLLKQITFKDHPPGPGRYRYTIRIGSIPGGLNRARTKRHFRVTVRQDKLQVLLINNQPGWDYQYLVKYLSRNPRVHLQAILLHPQGIPGIQPPAPVQASPKNPSYLAQVLPQTLKQWSVYDVIILGDISPSALSTVDQQAIVAAVKNRGAALVLIAGPDHMPRDYAQQPLETLLPVKSSGNWQPAILEQQFQQGFIPVLTPEGLNSTFGQFGLTQSSNAHRWRDMPRWYWHSRQTSVKSAAQALWAIGKPGVHGAAVSSSSKSSSRFNHRALLATMSVGSGRVLYLASNEDWRLRQIDGENLQNTFWSEVLRWAVGSQLPAGGRYVRFGINHHNFQVGRRVRVRARVLGENLLPRSGLTFRASVALMPTTTTAKAPTSSRSVASALMIPVPGSPGFYDGTLNGLLPGRYQLQLRGKPVSTLLRDDPTATVKTITFMVSPRPNLEMLNTASNAAQMQRIASSGRGIMLPGPFADILSRQIPNMKRTLKIPEQTAFFGNPNDFYTKLLHFTFLILFTLVIAAEWIIRKSSGIV